MDKEYERLLREIRDAYFVIQGEKVMFLSAPFLSKVGYDVDDLIGRPLNAVFPPDFVLGMEGGAGTGPSCKTEERFRSHLVRKDGTPIPVDVLAWATEFEGKPATAGVLWDVAERQETEQALRESEEKLRVMLESIADGIAVIDLESRILDMNPVMLRLYGYERKEDVIGRSAFEFISAKDQDRARENMRQTLEEGYSGHLEITLHSRDGGEYEAEVSAAPLRDKPGGIVGFIAITKDITERKKAEESLRRAEELNRTLVETASRAGEGLAVLQDRGGGETICVFVNDEFARILGYSVEDLLGRPTPETVPAQMRMAQLGMPEGEHVPGEAPARFELELTRKDGSTIPADIGVGTTTYKGMPATVAYVTDISERKRQESENLQLQDTLRFYSSQVVKASKELLHAIRELHARESMIDTMAGRSLLKRSAAVHPEPVRIDEVEMLTSREIQVLQLAARGMSNKDIASELGIAVRTVKGHLINVYAKMKVRSRTEAVSCALKEGWIGLEDMGQME